MADGTGGMAVLVLLSALLATVNANLSIQLGRIDFNQPSVETFDVEGVATVQIGGESAPIYYLDCIRSQTNVTREGLQWTRETGQLSPMFTIDDTITHAQRLQMNNVQHSDLDVYVCTDTNTGDFVKLNVTSANPAVCPVMDMVTTTETLATQLDVYVSGYPVPRSDQIHWYRPNGVEIQEDDENVQFANSRKRLILSNIKLSDAGTYDVEVAVPLIGTVALRARTGIDLIVEVPPTVIRQPVNITTVYERQSFSLSCTVSGNPTPSVSWQRMDGAPLNTQHTTDTQSSTNIFLSNVTSTLTVPSSLYSDMGLYRCSATNSRFLVPVFSDFSEVIVRPVLTLSATDTVTGQTIQFSDVISQPEGSQFMVVCTGSGDIQWTSSTGSRISSNSSDNVYQTHDITSNRLTLTFRNFSVSQIAVYTCESPLRDVSNVPITESVFITNSDPAVYITPAILYVLEGGMVSIEAGVSASSNDLTVEWFLNGLRLDIATDPHLSQTVENSMYTLTITDISSQRLGEYTVVVTIGSGGPSDSDSVNVSYSAPPTVSVYTSQLTVNESGEVRVHCQADGVGVVTVRWFFNGNDLPNGVTQSEDDLYISSATRTHTGVYECRVSNIAGTVNDTVSITVNYPPFSEITYNLISSTSDQFLSVHFLHEDIAPNFICSSEGLPVPQVSWRMAGGEEFRNGIETQSDGSQLVWGRRLEYDDSGRYECVSENVLGTSVATMELTVQFLPIINSISPSASIEVSSSTGYLLPTGFTGVAITCGAFAWPPPFVEWLYEGDSLPEGVQSFTAGIDGTGSRSARLVFTTGFSSSLNGQYQCVVKESETSSSTSVVRNFELTETETVTPTAPPSCSASSSQVNFQLRVLDTDCSSWSNSLKDTIRSAFRDEIMLIAQMECNCTVTQNTIQIPDLPTCSTKVENGVVFRGTIETSSVIETETLFCALSNWQQANPSININGQLFQVDSGCSLRLDSFSDQECVAVTTPSPIDQITLILVIAVPVGGILLIILVLLLLIGLCVKCYGRSKRRSWNSRDRESGPRPIARTGQTVAPSSQPSGDSVYQTLHHQYGPPKRKPTYSMGDTSPTFPLEPVGSQSRDRLLSGDRESFDGDIRYIHTGMEMDTAMMSNGNVERVAIFEGKRFPCGSESSSGASSRVTSPPQRAMKTVVSATNPFPDYEELGEGSPHFPVSRQISGIESVNGRKFSEGSNSPSMLTSTRPYAVLERDDVFSPNSNSKPGSVVTQGTTSTQGTASLRNFSRSSFDAPSSGSPAVSVASRPSQASGMISEEPRRASDCSEGLPPYSSRPSSELTPSTSMLDNSAYGRVNPTPGDSQGDHHEHQWYMNSDLSLDSKSSRHGPNGRTVIPPYAMIQNSAIPYEPTSITQQTDTSNYSGQANQTPPTFRVDTRKHSTPQPYSEPVRSSLGSIASQSSFHTTPKFETIVV